MITNPLPIDIKDYRTQAAKAVRSYVNSHFGGFFSEDDIQDIISEVVKRMWKARDTFDPSRKFFSWLWKISQNAVSRNGKSCLRRTACKRNRRLFKSCRKPCNRQGG